MKFNSSPLKYLVQEKIEEELKRKQTMIKVNKIKLEIVLDT